MSEEKSVPKCPCCDREANQLKEFPLVKIQSFEYLEIPRIVKGPVEATIPSTVLEGKFIQRFVPNPQLPPGVDERLERTGEDISLDGRVYSRVHVIWDGEEPRYVKEDMQDWDEKIARRIGREYIPDVRVRVDLTGPFTDFWMKEKGKLSVLERNVGQVLTTREILKSIPHDWRSAVGATDFSYSFSEQSIGKVEIEVVSCVRDTDMDRGFAGGVYEFGFSLLVARFTYEGLFREA